MQKWRRVGGTGGGLPPVVTVIDWGGGGLALVLDFREIHVIRGDLKNPAEARGRPQAKHRAATRQLQPSPECDTVPIVERSAKPQERFFPRRKQHRCTIFSLAGSRARERRACAADVSRLASDLQGAAGLNRCMTVVWHVGFT